MKISLGISSRLVQIVKVTVLTMSLFRQFYLKKALNALIRRVHDMLRNLCVINCFGFICNDMITTKYLWKDGIHLQDLGTSILSKNFIEFANNYLLRLRVTQNALQFFFFFPHSSFSQCFWTDWQKLFSKFCSNAALSACDQDRS